MLRDRAVSASALPTAKAMPRTDRQVRTGRRLRLRRARLTRFMSWSSYFGLHILDFISWTSYFGLGSDRPGDQRPQRIFHNGAVAQPDLPGTPGRERIVVRDQNERHAAHLLQIEQEIGDLFGAGAVEIPGRLIGKQQLRLADDGARDRHTLTLAARKPGDQMVRTMIETDAAQHHPGAGIPMLCRHAAAKKCEFDVFQHRQGRNEVEFLEYDADTQTPQPYPILFFANRPPLPNHMPGGRIIDAAQDIDEAALAAAAGADDGDTIALSDLQVDVSKRRYGAAVMNTADAAQRDQRFCAGRPIGTGAPVDGLNHADPTSLNAQWTGTHAVAGFRQSGPH